MDSTPEAQARRNIDDQLEESGWTVQDYKPADITASLGVAIRDFQLQGRGAADYLLYADGKAIGVVFVKIRSITAKIRNDLSTKLGRTGSDQLIILGATELEAYPVTPSKSGSHEIPGAFAWTGVQRLFEKLRFRPLERPGQTRIVYLRRFRSRSGRHAS